MWTAFGGEIADGRWYRAGDVASVDDHGYSTFMGRTDDVFKSNDYKISPFELASVFIEQPTVGEARGRADRGVRAARRMVLDHASVVLLDIVPALGT